MRLFIALDIDGAIRERIVRFVDGVREFAPDARWVPPESLHITLKFIGERPAETVAPIRQTLSGIKSVPFDVTFRGHGFFPTPKAPRVFWIGIAAGAPLANLAIAIDLALEPLGIPREDHAYSPHLTLARGGKSGTPRWQKSDGPNHKFKRLAEKLSALPPPEFGTMTAHEFFLYESKLGRGGSVYTKLERFGLGEN